MEVPRAQLQLLGLNAEIIVDLFAGGGGASVGIEAALGRQVDAAVNHDPAAVALHEANHPQTAHYQRDVFEVEPMAVTQGRPVGLLWASPDCTFHSKARGGKPIRSGVKKRRALAWVVTRWAGQVRPRVIMLENVEEFAQWGPLVGPPDSLKPCPKRRGKTFRQWVRSLERLGYVVEWRELRACDFGAPTIRKRLFLVARCDGQPIVWPEPTHAPAAEAKARGLRPYRTAAECIDWSLPCPSIFERARPLAENTLRRIARGVKRYVLENPRPFVVANNMNNVPRFVDEPLVTVTGGHRHLLTTPFVASAAHGEVSPSGVKRWGPGVRSLEEPASTVLAGGNGSALVAPSLAKLRGTSPAHVDGAGPDLADPLHTVGTGGNHALVSAFLAQHNEGPRNGSNAGRPAGDPLSTVTASGSQQGLVAASLTRFNENAPGAAPDEPLGTVVAGAQAHGLVAAHVTKFRTGSTGHAADEPLHTVTGATSTTEGCRPGGAAPFGVVAAHVQRDFGNSTGHGAGEPLGTVTSGGGGHAALVAAFLASYYGQGDGQDASDPLRTVTTRDRFGLVTVEIGGEPFVVTDIGMRMLQPAELYAAQGFPAWYRIDRGADGKALTKTEQVRMCGNSVCPPLAAALAGANVPELRSVATRDRRPLRAVQRRALAA